MSKTVTYDQLEQFVSTKDRISFMLSDGKIKKVSDMQGGTITFTFVIPANNSNLDCVYAVRDIQSGELPVTIFVSSKLTQQKLPDK